MTLNINPVNWFEISAVYEKDVAELEPAAEVMLLLYAFVLDC